MEYTITITQTESDLEVSDNEFKRFTVRLQVPKYNHDHESTVRMVDDFDEGWIDMNCDTNEFVDKFLPDIDIFFDIHQEIIDELQSRC